MLNSNLGTVTTWKAGVFFAVVFIASLFIFQAIQNRMAKNAA